MKNYWLDLIKFESHIKACISKCIDIFVGKRYSSSIKLRSMLTEAVRDCLDEIARKENHAVLDIDYELEMEYEDDMFISFKINYLHADGI